VFGTFLDASADVRYFGATMSVDMKGNYEGFEDYLPDHFTGPVQFSPAKTLHPVTENEEYNSLTSVIATGEGRNKVGSTSTTTAFSTASSRFMGWSTRMVPLTRSSPRRTSSAWTPYRGARSRTRQSAGAKVGQEPRLYLRVEYEDESFHLGGLTRDLDIDEEHSAPVDELRNVRDFMLDGTDLVSRLGRHADRIARVRVVASDVLDVTVGDEVYTAGDKPSEHGFYDALREAVGDAVEVVDVYDEAAATMPK